MALVRLMIGGGSSANYCIVFCVADLIEAESDIEREKDKDDDGREKDFADHRQRIFLLLLKGVRL